MNKPSKTHKPKGISVEGFWRQLNNKTAKKDSGQNIINSSDSPDVHLSNANVSDANKDNWESRFDEWLDRL